MLIGKVGKYRSPARNTERLHADIPPRALITYAHTRRTGIREARCRANRGARPATAHLSTASASRLSSDADAACGAAPAFPVPPDPLPPLVPPPGAPLGSWPSAAGAIVQRPPPNKRESWRKVRPLEPQTRICGSATPAGRVLQFSSSPVLQFSRGVFWTTRQRQASKAEHSPASQPAEEEGNQSAAGEGCWRRRPAFGVPLARAPPTSRPPPFSGDLVPQTAPDTARRATCKVFARTHHFISHFSHLLRPRRGTRASGQARTRESKLTIIADGLAHQRVRDNPKRCHGKGGFVLQARTRFGGWLSRRRRRRRPPGRRWWAAGRWTGWPPRGLPRRSRARGCSGRRATRSSQRVRCARSEVK